MNNDLDLSLDKLSNDDLWKACEKGLLFELFNGKKKDNDFLNVFFDVVENVISSREYVFPGLNSFDSNFEGKLISFSPSATMYDGVAEELSDGFFDSDDVPPPEFWVQREGDKLISYIPKTFIQIANLGLENCMSCALEWC